MIYSSHSPKFIIYYYLRIVNRYLPRILKIDPRKCHMQEERVVSVRKSLRICRHVRFLNTEVYNHK